MSEFDVVCVSRSGSGEHGHITRVGVAQDNYPTIMLSVKAVRQMIKWTDVKFFSTDSTGNRVKVWRYRCGDCGTKTIRTGPDDVRDDNLSGKPLCP